VSGAEPTARRQAACDEQVPLRGGIKPLDRTPEQDGRKAGLDEGRDPTTGEATARKRGGERTNTMEL
jgi:hypothetical protein